MYSGKKVNGSVKQLKIMATFITNETNPVKFSFEIAKMDKNNPIPEKNDKIKRKITKTPRMVKKEMG